ncbi:hypothetical protein [Rhodococcus sovatensis]|uniref:Uncharacterized protein n=1 Tax=Rhodococcus sovatensis TaxID=1805840 RepID=A0ABZ2PHQ9_9NOCA
MSQATRRIAEVRCGEWHEITPTPEDVQTVRVCATDLGEALITTARIRDEAHQAERKIAVYLDVVYHVADDARKARQEAAPYTGQASPRTVMYIGTRAGLTGLIDDIAAADVADGVTLLPLLPTPRSAEIVRPSEPGPRISA